MPALLYNNWVTVTMGNNNQGEFRVGSISWPHRAAVPEEIHARQPQPVEVPPIEQIPAKYIALGLVHLRNQMAALAKMAEDNSRPVDEYNSQTLAPESETTLTLQPAWEVTEVIKAIIVTGPPVVNANPVPSQPAVPATGVAQQNVNNYAVQVVISANGATISNVSVNGVTVGTAAGTYAVPAFGSISIAYTVATPTWVWSYTGPQLTAASGFTLQLGDRTWSLTLPATGFLVIGAPIGLILARNDVRQLTTLISGQWTLELMGHCDDRAG